jgi:hypothetical protein
VLFSCRETGKRGSASSAVQASRAMPVLIVFTSAETQSNRVIPDDAFRHFLK